MDILHDTYTWVIFSFLVFLGAALRFGLPAMLRGLDTKIAVIRAEVQTAETLRAEAHALLLEFEERKKCANAESDKMIAKAREQAEAFRLREEAKLEEMMHRKEQQLNERLAILRDQTVAELRQVAATLAYDATQKMIAQKMDDATKDRLIDRALAQVSQRLA